MLLEEGLSVADLNRHAVALQHRFQSALQGHDSALGQAEWLNPVVDNEIHSRFLALRHSGAGRLKSALLEKNIVTDVRDDVIRFGFGPYHDETDVARLIEVSQAL